MARKRKQEEINEQNNIVESEVRSTSDSRTKVVSEPQTVYRIKDESGNIADYNSLEALASEQEINLGICYKYLNSIKTFCGMKIYSFKK